jgi:hypothetical protein
VTRLAKQEKGMACHSVLKKVLFRRCQFSILDGALFIFGRWNFESKNFGFHKDQSVEKCQIILPSPS